MKVLIVKLSSIGDVVHTLPALAALRRGFEEKGIKARIDWLVEEASSGILKGNPLIDDVIVVRSRGWTRNLKENLKVARALSKRRYDMVLDFQGLLKSGVWVYLTKGKRRIGFSNARELSRIFYNEKLPPYDPEKHAIERYLDLARYAGGVAEGAVLPGLYGAEAEKSVVKKMRSLGVPEGAPFFVMVTRARWDTKLWSDSKFIELAKRLLEDNALWAVLAGGSEDRAGLDSMAAAIGKRAVNMAGMTDLKELAALMGTSRFCVTVDSGPMHIAAAAGAKVVAIFGPTAPWRTGPHCQRHIVVRKGIKCSPCFRKHCTDAKCMNEITADEVMAAVEGVLRG